MEDIRAKRAALTACDSEDDARSVRHRTTSVKKDRGTDTLARHKKVPEKSLCLGPQVSDEKIRDAYALLRREKLWEKKTGVAPRPLLHAHRRNSLSQFR